MLKIVYKPVGITPYQLSLKIKQKYPYIQKIAYVYRLDPMAHGEILILINDSCKLTNDFVKLNSYKIYEFSILFGITTDTLDILGNITDNTIKNFDFELILKNKNKFVGKSLQEYPIFCSKTIEYNGKMTPLWKLKDLKHKIEIPKKEINIDYIKYINHHSYTKKKIFNYVYSRLKLVTDKKFDTQSFINQWKLIKNDNYLVVNFITKVSTGTYIRELCKQIGILCNYNSINFNIYRKNILLL
jgi:tRNA pseudouridine(55) synthase